MTPQEQWGNIPVIGKLQILTFIGMLESYGEIPGDVPHYTAPGSLAGYYPPVKGSRPEIFFVLYLQAVRQHDHESQTHDYLGRYRVPPEYFEYFELEN